MSHSATIPAVIFREGKDKDKGRKINVQLPLTHLATGDLAHNPGMYPDWELNQ